MEEYTCKNMGAKVATLGGELDGADKDKTTLSPGIQPSPRARREGVIETHNTGMASRLGILEFQDCHEFGADWVFEAICCPFS